jgi:hypothetical protein
MALSVYCDDRLGFPAKPTKQPEQWSWLEEETSPIAIANDEGPTQAPTPRSTSTTTHIAPVLASQPQAAVIPTMPLKAWVRHVQAFSESETLFRLQEEILDYHYKNRKALNALNIARVMVHNVFGFTGRRADQAKTSMYLYQITLVYVAHRLGGRTTPSVLAPSRQGRQMKNKVDTTDTKDADGRKELIQGVMEDERFHSALITVCLEMCAFVYRDEDGRFSDGFPVLTNALQQGGHLPEFLACLDWFAQAFGLRSFFLSDWASSSRFVDTFDASDNEIGFLCHHYSPLFMPMALRDYVHLISDAVVDKGLFGPADTSLARKSMMTQRTTVPVLSSERSSSLVSYCLRCALFYLHGKTGELVRQAWTPGEDVLEDPREPFIRATQHMVDVLVRERLDILFGAACSLVAVCCAFCTGKLLGLKEVRLAALCASAKIPASEARTFYNDVFLPVVYCFEEHRLFNV